MINKNCWKQPVPVDFMIHESFTYLEKMLLAFIFLEARREPETITRWNGNRQHTIDLQRGQSYLNMSQVARDLGLDSRQIKKSLENLAQKYKNIENEWKTYGVITTVLDYDEAVKMENETKTKRKRNENEMKSYIDKDRKTDKTVKTEEKETADKPPSFPSDSKEYKFAQRFFERLQEINPTIKKPNLSRWAADFDLILRVDKRDEQQLGKVVAYALTGFWRGKVMSPKKLREKYDTLTTQMMTDTDKQGKPTAAGLAASDTELEMRVTSSGHEYVVRKDVPQGFVPPEFVGMFGLNQQKWKDRTDDGTLFFVLKEWYAKHGQNNTEFEKKYCNTPTHD